MTTGTLEQMLGPYAELVVPLTVDQYQKMIETGLLPEGAPIELIDGLLVHKDRRDHGGGIMTVGERHRMAVDQLMQTFMELRRQLHCRVSCQQPIRLGERDMPEPDITLIRGEQRPRTPGHPDPDELLLVVEVADSSLSFDRTTKLAKYAGAGVREYWIVNLADDVIEVYRSPLPDQQSFGLTDAVKRGGQCCLTLPDGSEILVAVDEIL